MLAIIVFIIILGVLIFVHELGHFVTARRNGIKASEFGFGFPPRIVGIQFLSGKQKKRNMELESVEVETIDVQSGQDEVRKEIITKKMHEVEEVVPIKRWRLIWGAKDGDEEEEKNDLMMAHKKKMAGGTIYSLNWIPLGGFVKIKGENGGNAGDSDSFSGKSAWVRIKVLAAGVLMNFILAWVLFSVVFMVGAPTAIDQNSNISGVNNRKIQISDVSSGTPAEKSGIRMGDEIINIRSADGESIKPSNIKDIQSFISSHAGKEVVLSLKRGAKKLDISAIPRLNTPDGQGSLGVSLVETVLVSYPWYRAIWEGIITTFNLICMILLAFVGILHSLIMGHGAGADVSGPVGIAVLTKEVTGLGLVYVLQFAAMLSVNLGIINILPIPALDGGRILFIIIEKIKGSPVSARVEQALHSFGFILLIGLLVLVTFRDVLHYVK